MDRKIMTLVIVVLIGLFVGYYFADVKNREVSKAIQYKRKQELVLANKENERLDEINNILLNKLKELRSRT
jgi:cell division protein FtsN